MAKKPEQDNSLSERIDASVLAYKELHPKAVITPKEIEAFKQLAQNHSQADQATMNQAFNAFAGEWEDGVKSGKTIDQIVGAIGTGATIFGAGTDGVVIAKAVAKDGAGVAKPSYYKNFGAEMVEEAGEAFAKKPGVIRGLLRGGGAVLSKAAVPITVGFGAWQAVDAYKNHDDKGVGEAVGSTAGTLLASIAAGAAIGTVATPVIGTIVGAVAGIGGYYIGKYCGGEIGEHWDAIKAGIGKGVDAVADEAKDVGSAISNKFNEVAANIKNGTYAHAVATDYIAAQRFVNKVDVAVENHIKGAFNDAVHTAGTGLKAAENLAQTVGHSVETHISDAFNAASSGLDAAKDVAEAKISSVQHFFGHIFGGGSDGGTNTAFNKVASGEAPQPDATPAPAAPQNRPGFQSYNFG